MQREAGLGPGGYSKPQQELEPFGPKTRAWTPYSGEGLRLASTCPPATQGPPTPFQKLSDLCGGQACVCPGWMHPGRCTQSGKEPLPQVPPGPLPQEGWWSAGMRNSSGEEPDTPTPGCPPWDPAHSSAAGGLLGVLRVLGGAERPLPGLVHTHRQSAGDRGTRTPFSLGWRCSGHA